MHSSSLRCSLPAVVDVFPLDAMAAGRRLRGERPLSRRHPRQRRAGLPAGLLRRPPALLRRHARARRRPRRRRRRRARLARLRHVRRRDGCCPRCGCTSRRQANDDVWRILGRNSRTPGKVLGDIHALVAGTFVLGREHRSDARAVRRRRSCPTSSRTYLDATERQTRESWRRCVPARYSGSFTIDSDGVSKGVTPRRPGHGRPRRRRAASGSISTGRRAQSPGAINSSFSQTISGVVYAVRCLIDPSIPMNEGCFRPLDIVLPPGHAGEPESAGGLRWTARHRRRRHRGRSSRR